MMDGGHELGHQLEHAAAAGLSSAFAAVMPWLLPALLAGAIAYFLRRFAGDPIPSLLSALLDRGVVARRGGALP